MLGLTRAGLGDEAEGYPHHARGLWMNVLVLLSPRSTAAAPPRSSPELLDPGGRTEEGLALAREESA